MRLDLLSEVWMTTVRFSMEKVSCIMYDSQPVRFSHIHVRWGHDVLVEHD